MLCRLLGALLICVAVTLVYMGFVMPGATDAEPVFAGSRKLTVVTLRQLETVRPQINAVEENTRLLAETTESIHEAIPTVIPLPVVPVIDWDIPDWTIPRAQKLKRNAKAIAATAGSIHATSESLKRDIPEVVQSIKGIDKALSNFEARTKQAMRLSRVLVWLISVVPAIQGLTLMVKPRQDVANQPGG